MALFIINILGAIVYVRAAALGWVIPEERAHGVYSLTGEPFVWFLAVLPIIAGFGLLNLVWGGYICVKRNWQTGYFWLATALVWVIAVCFDFAHH